MGHHPVAAEICTRLARLVPGGSALCVGFSGGLDSTVLLDVLSEHAGALGYRVSALHVNHGLSTNAADWTYACERFCARNGVALAIEHVRVEPGAPEGVEAAARAARYAAYAARRGEYVVLGHHLDDQAETVLLQLLRGTGLKGVAAMPGLRELKGTGVSVVRPMLELRRAELADYARAKELPWIEDESNASTRFDRNYVRLELGPRVNERYPNWREALARFARHAGAASDLLEQLATLDGVPVQAGEPLALRHELGEERRANALRAFLARNAVAMPPEARLAEMSRQLFGARDDARVRIDHAGVAIVRHKDAVRIERGLGAPNAGADAPWRVDWRHERDLDLGAERGSVHFEPALGRGIAAAAAGSGAWYFAARSGGETIRVAADRPTRTLKNLLQEREVPVWQREKLPLLFHGGTLVWVPGVGIAADYACPVGQEGFDPSWRVAGRAPVC